MVKICVDRITKHFSIQKKCVETRFWNREKEKRI